MTIIEGRLVQGLGQGAGFTQIDWVCEQLMAQAGIDPYPGTLNLVLEDDRSLALWRNWRDQPGQRLAAPQESLCNARCYPARINGSIPAAVILPEVTGYPEDKLELVAALPLREHLSLAEGCKVSVELCRPLPVAAILFDIDGTLVDSTQAFLEVARAAAAPHGLEVTAQHVRDSLANGSNFWQDILPPDRPDYASIMKRMTTHAYQAWPGILLEHGKVFAGTAEILTRLKRQGITLAIVSGAYSAVLDLLRASDLLEMFDAIILGGDVAKPKPDPEGIRKCLQQLGVAPGAALYVGDTPIDVQTSRAAGVYSVGVLSGAGTSANLSAQAPDRLIGTLAGLPDCVIPEK
ncbi:MAG: HAD-IA family hydrolase [Sterolibacterium sp.]